MNIHPSIKKYYQSHRFDLQPCHANSYTDRAAVIIESRVHPMLTWTIANILHFTNWPIIVYHSKKNEHLIKSLPIAKKILIQESFSTDDYNVLLTSTDFWKSLPKHVLIFQTDSFLIRRGIENFLSYDYIGAPWSRKNMEKNRILLNTGNGGLSLRNRDKMLDLTRLYPRLDNSPEDIYISNAFIQSPGNLPPLNIQLNFSVEQIYYHKPLGLHAPWKALNMEDIKNILALAR